MPCRSVCIGWETRFDARGGITIFIVTPATAESSKRFTTAETREREVESRLRALRLAGMFHCVYLYYT